MTTHPSEDHAVYGYYQGSRKIGNFHDTKSIIDFSTLLDYEKAAFMKLNFVDAQAEGINYPLSNIAEVWADTQFFMLEFEGDLYFVDTQGFNYCRYVAKVVNFPSDNQ